VFEQGGAAAAGASSGDAAKKKPVRFVSGVSVVFNMSNEPWYGRVVMAV